MTGQLVRVVSRDCRSSYDHVVAGDIAASIVHFVRGVAELQPDDPRIAAFTGNPAYTVQRPAKQ